MTEVIGVKFNKVGKVYYFDPKGNTLEVGRGVVVETARGVEFGYVAVANREVADDEIVAPLKPIIRAATNADYERLEKNKEKEKEAFEIAANKIREHKLDMKLINTEYTFDGSKILFYFTADGRIDFRELVKSLAGIFKTRIELRQMGVRDEAKTLGAIGGCGRTLCCSTFLNDFHPVSIRMAKDQGLSLNPTKISGICGRLMCCLQYEQVAYEDLLKKVPNKGSLVEYDGERGVVNEVYVLKGLIKVKFGTQEEPVFKILDAKDVKILKKGKTEVPEDVPDELNE
ncbi:MAG: stage 0 sporulation family protein [Clostridia bacterium]|nr:stage 0 sporulation family protein [Clostridia bacterium]